MIAPNDDDPGKDHQSQGTGTRPRIPSLIPVLATGALMTAGAGLFLGAHAALSTAAGVALAVLDLYVLTRMVSAMVGIDPARQGARWAPVVLLKFLLLFTGVILLLSRKIFLPLPFLTGIGALPLGIVLGTLFRE
ncbi:hypothetical protein [Pendulispora albinea]|uniref:ATP synthase protein I n=1 Tax=Pendulispora albinea TaxID=2741071 RepID=A0ABZ2LX17_9BACT